MLLNADNILFLKVNINIMTDICTMQSGPKVVLNLKVYTVQ